MATSNDYPPLGSLDPNTDTVPEVDSERGFRLWHESEIYTGPNGKGKYVPNVDDGAINWDSGFKRVISVDYTNGKSVLTPWYMPRDPNADTDYDIIMGAGPGLFQSECCRIYFNGAVTPHTLNVDRQLYVYGREVKSCKIFRGYNYGSLYTPIGIWFTENGVAPTENIPLELVGTRLTDNVSIKVPVQAYTTAVLEEGEPCTVVFYSDDGSVLSKSVVYTSVTTFTRPIEASQRIITGIALVSPNLNKSETTVLDVPINTTIESLMVMCRVYFNDGYQDYPIDGTKVRLDGMESFIASIDGERIPLVLTYVLSSEESTVVGTENGQRYIARPYYARSISAVGAYSLKLYPVPMWKDEFTGYELEWYLYNADRKRAYYATPYVEWNPNTPGFEGLKYGTLQTLGTIVEVSKVDPTLNPHLHTQTLGITLMGNPNTADTPWLISFSQNTSQLYGLNLSADYTFVTANNWRLTIDCGYESVTEWLDALYWPIQPLFIPGEELKAPTPTHFKVVTTNSAITYPIASWNQTFSMKTAMPVGQAVMIQWIQQLADVELQLGCSPLVSHHESLTLT